jgi:hypothetical protein
VAITGIAVSPWTAWVASNPRTKGEISVLTLEDDRMARPFGPRSSDKLYVNEGYWIQTVMDSLLAISDEMISVKCGQMNFNS